MPKYPIYLELQDKQAVVIGAGSVAARKTKTLVSTGANVRVVAQNIEPAFKELCEGLPITIIQGHYSKEHIQDAFLVIAATDDNALNTEIFEDCQKLKTLCNVVDVPHLCNFYVPAVINRGDLQLAISTNGKSAVINRGDLQLAISTNGKCPAYAGRLRRKFQELITEDHGRFLELLDSARQSVIDKIQAHKRKEVLARLSDDDSYQLFLEKGPADWKAMSEKLISDYQI
ncbi:MAG: precorrin-2 dehydrogenase/sirohydrochlorin ferrochelatase family protein [Planctomycetota bacterium]|jgi:siroheme synthase (precorrin-2 oxidase/ferrochelatase)